MRLVFYRQNHHRTDTVRPLQTTPPSRLAKQFREHPELTAEEYQSVQHAIDRGETVQNGQSLIYILEEDQYIVVVKATRTGKGLFLTSFRRLHSKKFKRDGETERLAGKVGAIAKPANGHLLFAKKGQAKSVGGLEIPPINLTPKQVSSWRVSLVERGAYASVKAKYRDKAQSK